MPRCPRCKHAEMERFPPHYSCRCPHCPSCGYEQHRRDCPNYSPMGRQEWNAELDAEIDDE